MNPQSRVFAAILGGTIVGPVIEVEFVKILDQFELEVAIPSPNDKERTSYVVISKGESLFVGEIHIPNAALRGGGMSCATRVSSQTSNRETCANTFSILSSQAPLVTQGTTPTKEREWKVTPASDS